MLFRSSLIYKSQIEQRSIEWTRNLTSTTAEMKRFLPLPTSFGEPKPEDLQKFELLVRSIIRGYFLPPHPEQWYDIVMLLVEFCPREVSAIGAASGRESRLFNSLTPTQKKVVISVMTKLGKNPALVKELIKFGRKNYGNRFHQYTVEIIGAFKAKIAGDYFIECLKDKKLHPIHSTVISALGSLTEKKAIKLLKERLSERLGVRTIEPKHRREIEGILSALAKISRNKSLSDKERNALIRDVIEMLGNKDIRLNLFCARNFFLVRLEDINPAFRAWAAEKLVEGLWLKDTSPEFSTDSHEGDRSRRTLLGRREDMANLLIKIGPSFLPNIIETAERHMIHYSGAYMAIGEVMGKIGDERAVPLLEKLLTGALVMEESEIGKYEKDYFWNPESEARQELNKDKVAFSLLYALNEIDGEEGDAVIEEFYEKIQAGQYNIPGNDTSDLLFKAHQRIQRSRGDEFQTGMKQETSRGSSLNLARRTSLHDAEQALKTLKKTFVLSGKEKKRLVKIRALQTIGKARAPYAIEDIIPLLDDKDAMISSAAKSALIEYNSPPMDIDTLRPYLQTLISNWESASKEMKKKIEDVLKKLHPENESMQAKISRVVETETDPRLRFAMERQFADYLAPQPEEQKEGASSENAEGDGSKQKPEEMGAVQLLEHKRKYMEARKKWIAGGKKGDPPKWEDFSP